MSDSQGAFGYLLDLCKRPWPRNSFHTSKCVAARVPACDAASTLASEARIPCCSCRSNHGPPYQDLIAADGTTVIYEGHDEVKSVAGPHPKAVDQPLRTASGTPTQNAKFHQAAQAYKLGQRLPERVRIYENVGLGFGCIVACFTWWILGKRGTGRGRCINSSSWPWRRRTKNNRQCSLPGHGGTTPEQLRSPSGSATEGSVPCAAGRTSSTSITSCCTRRNIS